MISPGPVEVSIATVPAIKFADGPQNPKPLGKSARHSRREAIMASRDMGFHGVIALGVVVGIVSGNFVLHRWMLGNATSRPVSADTNRNRVEPASHDAEQSSEANDLPELPPLQKELSPEQVAQRKAANRERLAKVIAEKFPSMSADQQQAWLEQLDDVAPDVAAGILELRSQIGPLDSESGKAHPDTKP